MNEIVGVEQSFTVSLHEKAAPWPFKLTSVMEFFHAITLFNFSNDGPCSDAVSPPLSMPVGAQDSFI